MQGQNRRSRAGLIQCLRLAYQQYNQMAAAKAAPTTAPTAAPAAAPAMDYGYSRLDCWWCRWWGWSF